MFKNKSSKGLIASIIFASVVVSSSLTFFGLQIAGVGVDGSDEKFQKEVFKAIDAYIADQQAEYEAQVAANAPSDYVENVSIDDDAILGDKDAPVTIVEFSDYQCSYCKRFVDDTLPLIKEKYIDTGKVNLVYRDYIVQGHSRALPSAIAAECVREQKGDEGYYKMHDAIFANQKGGLSDEALLEFAKEIGVNEAGYNSCILSGKYEDEIMADHNEGLKYQVGGTPGFFVNGARIEGAQPYATFEAAIEQALAQ